MLATDFPAPALQQSSFQAFQTNISPAGVLQLSAAVTASRQTIFDILDARDPRLLIAVGPCSIYDPAAAMDYALLP